MAKSLALKYALLFMFLVKPALACHSLLFSGLVEYVNDKTSLVQTAMRKQVHILIV